MFKDRREAGNLLAKKLKQELSPDVIGNSILLVIPRGGVFVGDEIHKELNIPLDCLITKKIPAPESEELSIGAVGEGGVVVWEDELLKRLNVPIEYSQEIVKTKIAELEKKKNDFQCGFDPGANKGKSVIIVDDGVATGATMKAAIAIARSFSPREIIVAVPVIAADALAVLKEKADKIYYLEVPEIFFSIDQYFEDFHQLSDEEVVSIVSKKI